MAEHVHGEDDAVEAITEHLHHRHGYDRSVLDSAYDEMAGLLREHDALHAPIDWSRQTPELTRSGRHSDPDCPRCGEQIHPGQVVHELYPSDLTVHSGCRA